MTSPRDRNATSPSLHGERAGVRGSSPSLSSSGSTPLSSPVTDGGGGPRSGSEGAPPTSASVRPSSTDPISRWLDIFIPMTGLPKARQTEIRAELDDHLRARTADLMITGLTEPDAVQRAVNELGETAHLARQFRTALKPRRNALMHTALIAAAGAAITLGAFSLTDSPAAPGQGHHGRTAEQVTGPSGEGSHMIEGLRGLTYGGLFDHLTEISPVPVLVHWDRLQDIGVDRNSELGFDVDTLPSHIVYGLIRERTAAPLGDPVAVEQSDDLIEVSLQSHFDRRSIGIVAHDIASLITYYEVPEQVPLTDSKGKFTAYKWVTNRRTAEAAGGEILETIVELVSTRDWRDMGGDLASARVVGSSLVVDAPERIHAEIKEVMAMMQAEVSRFELERKTAAEAAAAEQASAHAERLEAARAQLDDFRNSVVELESREREVQERMADLDNELRRVLQVMRHIETDAIDQIRSLNPADPMLNQSREELEASEGRIRHERTQLRTMLSDASLRLADQRALLDGARAQLVRLTTGSPAGDAPAPDQASR